MSALMMSGKALSAPHHMRSTLTSTSACYSGDYRSRKVSFQSRGSQCRKATIVRKGFPWEISGAEAAVQERLCFKPSEMVDVGPFKVSPMGFGTWAWGNKFLWDYDTKMDPELQEMFNLVVSKGINLFDTADSYGEVPGFDQLGWTNGFLIQNCQELWWSEFIIANSMKHFIVQPTYSCGNTLHCPKLHTKKNLYYDVVCELGTLRMIFHI